MIMEIADAKKNLQHNGFLDISVDPSLDLFAAIENLKRKKMLSFWRTITRNRISRILQITSETVWGLVSRLRKRMQT